MHDPQDLKLNERSQTQKVTCCMIPFIGNVQTRQIHRDRKQTDGCPRLEVKRNWACLLNGSGVFISVMQKFWN